MPRRRWPADARKAPRCSAARRSPCGAPPRSTARSRPQSRTGIPMWQNSRKGNHVYLGQQRRHKQLTKQGVGGEAKRTPSPSMLRKGKEENQAKASH
jgi:hypothetical protein